MNEELEFLISQYADGTLAESESRAVEAKLAEDAEARAVLEKHRRVIAGLRGMPTPTMPDAQWDHLSARINSTIAKAPAPAEEVPMTYRLFAGRLGWAAVGLAATVLIATSLTVRILVGGHEKTLPGHAPMAAMVRFLHVTGPRAQVARGPAMTDVSIGPGKGFSASGIGGGVVSRRVSVLVASGADPSDDSAAQSPF